MTDLDSGGSVDPRRTTAILVGIDRSDVGARWDLDGPVADVHRFATWLLSRGVPAQRITALVSPSNALPHWPVPVHAADRETVQRVLLRLIPSTTGDLLWVVWGGHGVVDAEGRRRLFYSDATSADKRNLDLDALLATYATEFVPSFSRQIWVVDACQTAVDAARLDSRTIPSETLPSAALVPGRSQDVLFAAGRGQRAVNVGAAATGLFSHELLEILGTDTGAWPPDMESLFARLRARFGTLRAADLTRQTPTYLWYRSHTGVEGQLLQTGPTGAVASAEPRSRQPDPELIANLVDALLHIDEFADPNGRQQILHLMRRELTGAIPRYPAARLDAFAIVRTCLRFSGGLTELTEVLGYCVPFIEATKAVTAAARALSVA